MNTVAMMTAVELGLIYTLLTLGVFISYRILDIPDLTVDGTFTLGAATSAILTLAGHPYLAILAAFGAGILAGATTAFLQTKLKVQPILAGILTMTGLYSINIMVMGNKSNVSLLGDETLFTKAKAFLGFKETATIVAVIIVLVCVIMIYAFLHTKLGLSIRATGDNEDMVRSSSVNVDLMKIIGLGLANGLVGISGALIAQSEAYVDITMGTGMVVIGIASLIMGEVVVDFVVKQRSIGTHLIAAILGSIVYRIIIALALDNNISASSMKLISSLIVIVIISIPLLKSKIKAIMTTINNDQGGSKAC